LFQEDIFGFQIAVNDSIPMKYLQTLQDGVGKLPDQRQTETLEFVLLDQLVQVHGEQLECDADVVSESKSLNHVNDVVCVFLVLFAQMFQDPDFFLGLSVEPLLIPDHLQRNVTVRLVIVRLDDLAKAALSDDFEDLVPVCDVIVGHINVLSGLVIIATILWSSDNPLALLTGWSEEVDVGIVEDFVVFIRG